MRSRFVGVLLFAAALVSLASGPALAQSSDPSASSTNLPDDLQSFAGDWELQQEDASAPTCAVSFTDQQVAGGWAITVPDACPAPYPAASALAVWAVDESDGSIIVMDANQKITMRLLADPEGFYATDEDSTPRFYLVTPQETDAAGGEQDAD
jgi:Protease inhibitor Inh